MDNAELGMRNNYLLEAYFAFRIPNSELQENGITERNTGQNRLRRLDTKDYECDEDGVSSQVEESRVGHAEFRPL